MNSPTYPDGNTPQSLYDWTQIMYALHALALLIGIAGSPTIVLSFLMGVPSIVAVIMNYLKRSEAGGTWLESHFRWQLRTFWFGALWALVCGLFVMLTLGLAIFVVWLPLGLLALWFIYRIVRGWLALRDRRPMYA